MPQNITLHVHSLVEAAEREIKTISAEQAVALHGRGDAVLVDLRDIGSCNAREGFQGPSVVRAGCSNSGSIPKANTTSPSSRLTSALFSSVQPANARRWQPRRRNAWD